MKKKLEILVLTILMEFFLCAALFGIFALWQESTSVSDWSTTSRWVAGICLFFSCCSSFVVSWFLVNGAYFVVEGNDKSQETYKFNNNYLNHGSE
jgi:hypothetical protein